MDLELRNKFIWIGLCLGACLGLGQTANAQYYGPYNRPVPRPYNPYRPYTPGQQRGWQDARTYEQTGMLPRYMTPNEARTFENKLMRDGFAPVPMQPAVPYRRFVPHQPVGPYQPYVEFRPY